MTSTPLLTVREVAAHLAIRTHAVLALIHSGALRASDCSKVPGGRPRWRIAVEDLESFLMTRTHSAAPKRRKRKRPTNVREYF